MNARLSFEASNQSATELRSTPQAIPERPRCPCFTCASATSPARTMVCWVLWSAHAVGGQVRAGQPRGGRGPCSIRWVFGASQKIEKITHPFIVDQVAEFDPLGHHVRHRGPSMRAGVCMRRAASSRARRSSCPRTVDPALKKLEPRSRWTDPRFERQGTLVPVLPAPRIEGMDAEFVHDDDATYPEMPLPPSRPCPSSGAACPVTRRVGADVQAELDRSVGRSSRRVEETPGRAHIWFTSAGP